MKDSSKPTFSAELLGTLLASGKIEELQSGAGLFAFAFALAGRHVLSLDEALDTLYAHGLPEHTPRAELAERILTGVRSDRAFVAYYGSSFTLSRGIAIGDRIAEAFLGPSARERVNTKIRQAKRDERRRTPLFSKPSPPKPRAVELAAPRSPSAGPPLPRRAPTPVTLTIDGIKEEGFAQLRATSFRVAVEPPRPGPVSALAREFVLRNGVARVALVSVSTATYVAALLAYAAEAGERREGVEWVVVGPDGSQPDGAITLLLDPGETPLPIGSSNPPSEDAAAAKWIAQRSTAALRAAVQPFVSHVGRKLAREHEQIDSKFEVRWAAAHSARAELGAAGVGEAEPQHLLTERDSVLRDLGARGAIRVSAKVVKLVHVTVPAGLALVRLRRRNLEREILLRVPAGAPTGDKLACEGCGEPTMRPAGCDGRLHLLCERCAPVTDGKITCPACAS